ncbi:Phosphoglyceromutase [hydrothermal vent metagenome]|uniref:Phosphoglyceromutase n=1 Tax=hydrothermal vent metagenome TaxID=652676 RepID=A0A3B1BW67_9ZZZZ
MHSTLMIFLDGVGIGEKDPTKNPFFQRSFKFFNQVFSETPHLENQNISRNNKYIFPVDACMNIEGLPQSGTGQTSIYCGINASAEIGQHFGPYAHSRLKPLIKEKNIFQSFKDMELKISFANAFPQVFFDYINSGKTRINVTSVMSMDSKMRFNDINDLKKENAISAEITNRRWVEKLNYDITIIKPEKAAQRLLNIASKNDFTLFEYFHSDHVGHGRLASEKEQLLSDLDQYLYYILTNIDKKITLLICSDHGNLEDMSVKGHTLNPALGISAGNNAEYLMRNITHLYDIKPAIMELYK